MSRLKFLRQTFLDIFRRAEAAPHRPRPAQWPARGVVGSCLGHSTVLLKIDGLFVLTDPVLFSRVGIGMGPLMVGPKRYVRCALRPKEIPPPDVILLSHAHMDHLDFRSLRRFKRDTPVVTANGTADLVQRLGFRVVHEVGWNESLTVLTARGPITFTGLRVAHWGARMLKDQHRGYNGYLIERNDWAVCFAGDTAYTDAFAALRERRAVDLMLVPIGAYDPWIRAHCSPEQAASMTRQAGAKHAVPIHHQTFKLSSEPMDEPIRRFKAAFAQEPGKILATSIGETFVVPPRTTRAATSATSVVDHE
jgi:L-ascorbate metabolism protein UlaG (beta-lactamase superfamily)